MSSASSSPDRLDCRQYTTPHLKFAHRTAPKAACELVLPPDTAPQQRFISAAEFSLVPSKCSGAAHLLAVLQSVLYSGRKKANFAAFSVTASTWSAAAAPSTAAPISCGHRIRSAPGSWWGAGPHGLRPAAGPHHLPALVRLDAGGGAAAAGPAAARGPAGPAGTHLDRPRRAGAGGPLQQGRHLLSVRRPGGHHTDRTTVS